MVFHEITRDAILRALDETRDVDERLVDAQETRRILDRLYGYEVSPVLWKKVTPRPLGRACAVRCDTPRRRRDASGCAFVVRRRTGTSSATFDPGSFEARLVALDGKRVAQGRDFGSDGTMRDVRRRSRLDEATARGLAERLEGAPFAVRSIDEKPYSRKPSAPFKTSTLQQEASRKLRFSAQTTMRVAQRLYEAGHITYMRTDSTTLAESALAAARAQAAELFGDDYVPADAAPVRATRSRTPRRRTRQSGPQASRSGLPKELAGEVVA